MKSRSESKIKWLSLWSSRRFDIWRQCWGLHNQLALPIADFGGARYTLTRPRRSSSPRRSWRRPDLAGGNVLHCVDLEDVYNVHEERGKKWKHFVCLRWRSLSLIYKGGERSRCQETSVAQCAVLLVGVSSPAVLGILVLNFQLAMNASAKTIWPLRKRTRKSDRQPPDQWMHCIFEKVCEFRGHRLIVLSHHLTFSRQKAKTDNKLYHLRATTFFFLNHISILVTEWFPSWR